MKNKLTLEHLSAYLPYGLKIRNILGKGSTWTLTQFNIEQFSDDDKPILRPLSDLTKDIEHNGEKFVPQKRIPQLEFEWLITSNKPYELVQKVNYEYFIKLLEWHFDVFGLREKNLCVYYNEI